MQTKLPPDDSDCTSDLSQWFHCANNKGLPDTVLSQAWDISKCVSFVFHHRSAAAAVGPSGSAAAEPDVDDDDKKKSKKLSKFLDDDEYINEELDDAPDNESDEDFVM